MKKKWWLGFVGIGLFVLMAFMPYDKQQAKSNEDLQITDETTVWEVYRKLGVTELHQLRTDVEGVSAERGKELVEQGYTTDENGNRTTRQSKFFTCNACHNSEKEFNSMLEIDAQKRLDYAIEHDLPFLQGSTFYGIVNRETFYNDDYQKKYAGVPDIVAANDDLRKAIHVCATECAQGRELEDWEMESIMAYFWSLELKLGDLELDDEEKEKIQYALDTEESAARAAHIIRDKFLKTSPAHFPNKDLWYQEVPQEELKNADRFNNGKEIYFRSCLHCHANKRFSFYSLDDNRSTFKHLLNATKTDKHHSIYTITRHGTYPVPGKRAYMPQYSLEKLSDDQLEDLRYYVEIMANGWQDEL